MFDTDKKLIAEMQRCQTECAFAKNVHTMSAYDPYVYIQIDDELHPYLPANRWTITIEKNRFSTELAREIYETLIAEWLGNGYELAVRLARRK